MTSVKVEKVRGARIALQYEPAPEGIASELITAAAPTVGVGACLFKKAGERVKRVLIHHKSVATCPNNLCDLSIL